MIQFAFLLISTILVSNNSLETVYTSQNISEEIYKMFSNLTPDYLGFNNFSYEYPGGFSISSMPSINISNNSVNGTR
jgi:hypothetical protein